MEITISSRNAELSPALLEATQEKIRRLARYDRGLERAEVHFYEQRNPRIAARDVCEVALDGSGHRLHSKAEAADVLGAVDGAVEKLSAQIQKLKTRRLARSNGT